MSALPEPGEPSCEHMAGLYQHKTLLLWAHTYYYDRHCTAFVLAKEQKIKNLNQSSYSTTNYTSRLTITGRPVKKTRLHKKVTQSVQAVQQKYQCTHSYVFSLEGNSPRKFGSKPLQGLSKAPLCGLCFETLLKPLTVLGSETHSSFSIKYHISTILPCW